MPIPIPSPRGAFRGCALVPVITFAILCPGQLAAWGQPAHAVTSWNTILKYGDRLPSACRDDDTRDLYLYASYGPDQYILHGPEYIHIDRHFSQMLFARAQSKEQLAFAYGWVSHQEQDVSGHGRYITESGMDHIYKELVIDSRLLKQGDFGERRVVREMKSVWDTGMISGATEDYVARYGSKYPVLSPANVNTTGYVFSVYLVAVKGILYALWYGRVKWKPSLFPRDDWHLFEEESVVQTYRWVHAPLSFGTDTRELQRLENFGFKMMDGEGLEPPEFPSLGSGVAVGEAQTLDAIHAALEEFKSTEDPFTKGVSPNFLAAATASSHVGVKDQRFVLLGERLIESGAVGMKESVVGDIHQVEVEVKSLRKLLVELGRALAKGGEWGGERVDLTGGDDLFTQLGEIVDRAADEAPDAPEDDPAN